MKKIKLLFTILLFIQFNSLLAQIVKVDTTITADIETLVKEVLAKQDYVNVTNVNYSTGTKFDKDESFGVGYFTGGEDNFPIKQGIIISTGSAKNATGPKTTKQSEGTLKWPGDLDLAKEIGVSLDNMSNATFVEFDFTTKEKVFNFNFVFASEEYGKFQCHYGDAFAFLLTDTVTGETENLAKVPNTNDLISVMTIRNTKYNLSCDSQNEDYFGRFFGKPGYEGEQGEAIEDSPTNFKGFTKKITANAYVVPNRKYHLKLVIADNEDYAFDSGIFFEANSLGGLSMGEFSNDDKFKIYPNPTTGLISISTKEKLDDLKVDVIDINGRVLMTKTITKNDNQLNIMALPKGIYMLNIKGENINNFKKIVKE